MTPYRTRGRGGGPLRCFWLFSFFEKEKCFERIQKASKKYFFSEGPHILGGHFRKKLFHIDVFSEPLIA